MQRGLNSSPHHPMSLAGEVEFRSITNRENLQLTTARVFLGPAKGEKSVFKIVKKKYFWSWELKANEVRPVVGHTV